jgi:hypothetical protein
MTWQTFSSRPNRVRQEAWVGERRAVGPRGEVTAEHLGGGGGMFLLPRRHLLLLRRRNLILPCCRHAHAHLRHPRFCFPDAHDRLHLDRGGVLLHGAQVHVVSGVGRSRQLSQVFLLAEFFDPGLMCAVRGGVGLVLEGPGLVRALRGGRGRQRHAELRRGRTRFTVLPPRPRVDGCLIMRAPPHPRPPRLLERRRINSCVYDVPPPHRPLRRAANPRPRRRCRRRCRLPRPEVGVRESRPGQLSARLRGRYRRLRLRQRAVRILRRVNRPQPGPGG